MQLPGSARSVTVAVIAAALALAALYAGVSALAPSSDAQEPAVERETIAEAAPGGPVLVRAVDPDDTRADGRVYELSPAGDATPAGDLACKRIAAAPGGRGLCLARAANELDYDGILIDSDYRQIARFPLEGVPDRARISPDGRYGAYTAFDRVGGIGYFESVGAFTTFTRIVDMRDGTQLLRLDDLDVRHRGRELDSDEGEFWGVTFAGGDRFYATFAVAGEHYLIESRIDADIARTVATRVECPALSPDGTRIAYKRRIGDSNRWRFNVLELESGERTALAETRSIDDQPEWLGDDRIVYSDDESVFTVPADGSGGPQLLASNATSQIALTP